MELTKSWAYQSTIFLPTLLEPLTYRNYEPIYKAHDPLPLPKKMDMRTINELPCILAC